MKSAKPMAIILFFVLLFLLLPGCGSWHRQYVIADRKTYQALGPFLRFSIDSDSTSSERLLRARRSLVDSWEARITAAEELLGEN